MSEYWAFCRSCQRSFYVSSGAGPEQPIDVPCPVCLTPAAEITATPVVEPS